MSMSMKQGLLGALLILGTAYEAVAQDNLFATSARNRAASRYYSASSGVNESTGRNGVNDNRLWGYGSADPTQVCNAGECAGVSPMPSFSQGTSEQGVTVPGPMRAHAEAVNSAAYTSQDVQSLQSVGYTKDIMWEYLDSGVAGGAFKQYMKGLGVFSNRMAAERAMFTQLQFVSPQVRDIAAAGYIGCMRAQQANGSWTMASDTCLEDQPVAGGQAFPVSGGGELRSWMSLHPDAPEGSNAATETIRLSDMLVEPIRRQMNAGGGSLSEIEQLRTSFVEYFGDKTFTMARPTMKGMPKSLRISVTSPSKDAAVLHRTIHDSTWGVLHDLMRGYCEYYKQGINARANTHVPFQYTFAGFGGGGNPWWWPNFTPSVRDFWANLGRTYPNGTRGPTAERYISLTTSTFEFTPLIGDALFSLFLKTQEMRPSAAGGGASAPNDLTCDVLRYTSPNDHSNYPRIAKRPQELALEWRKMYDQLVQLISVGKRYDIYMDAMRWVNRQTASSTDGDLIREHAESLVRAVIAPYDSPDDAQEDIATSVQLYLSELNRRKQSETGALGQQLAAGLGGGSQSSSSVSPGGS